jgi:hypothetical protein
VKDRAKPSKTSNEKCFLRMLYFERCDHLCRIGVTSVDHAHGQRVGREHEDHVVPVRGREERQLFADVVGEGLDQARVARPAVDGRPLHCGRAAAALVVAVDVVQAAAGR